MEEEKKMYSSDDYDKLNERLDIALQENGDLKKNGRGVPFPCCLCGCGCAILIISVILFVVVVLWDQKDKCA